MQKWWRKWRKENEESIEEQNVQDTNQVADRKKAARQKGGIKLSIDHIGNAEESTPFKTKHAACVAKILGKVVEYDKLCHQLKSRQKPTDSKADT